MKKYFINENDSIPMEMEYESVTKVNDARDLEFIGQSGVSFHTRIVNLTGERIVIKDRFGMEITMDPSNVNIHRHGYRELIIYEHHGFSHYTYPVSDIDLDKPDEAISTCTSQVHKKNIEEIRAKRAALNFRQSVTGVDISAVKGVITLDQLRTGIYVPSIDRIIFLVTSKKTYHHPQSSKGRMIIKKCLAGGTEHFSFSIAIHDKNSTIDCRWINVNGVVHRIPVIRDGRYADSIVAEFIGDNNTSTSMTYTIEEGTENLRLFSSREEALKYGDLKTELERAREKELLDAQKEVENLKIKLEKQKLLNSELGAENKRIDHMYDREKSDMDKEKSNMDHENFKEKSDMDKQAQRRKAFYEFLKIVPAIITAGISLVILLKKTKAST